MKEILKSKVLILFIIFMIGIICFNSYDLEQKNASAEDTNNQIINLKN